MSKYIDSACEQCDDYQRPYGCTNKWCTIYKDFVLERECRKYDEMKDQKAEKELENE